MALMTWLSTFLLGEARTSYSGGALQGSLLSRAAVSQARDREECVGKGAYGQVFKAVHHATGTVVALKIIDLDTADDDITEIQREVQLLTQLRDADKNNCTLYYGCWLEKTKLWIAMDYASGGSIRTIMKSTKTIEERFTVVITREVLIALAYLHRQGIIHRDIKAANILLTQTGKILLCDFGVAAHLHTSNKRSTFIGTPYWMAPEVIQESKMYDTKADIWSLGITLYEMSMGNPPFSNMEALRALQLIPRTKPAALDANLYSPLIRDFMALCLQENPSERLNAEELLKSKWIKSASKVSIVVLRDLIHRYTSWVQHGGVRQSLVNVAMSPDQSEGDDSPDSSWDFGTPMTHGHIADEYTGDHLGTDTGYPSHDDAKATVPAPRANHPLARLFETEPPPMPLLNGGAGYSSRSHGMPPAQQPQGLGLNVPAETMRPQIAIPSIGDDSDEESPPTTARLHSPTTIKAHKLAIPPPSAPLPPPPVMPAAAGGSAPGSPKLASSPRLLQRAQTPPSPHHMQSGFATPIDGVFADLPPIPSPQASTSSPLAALRDGGHRPGISPPYRNRTNTMPSQLSISTAAQHSPPNSRSALRGRTTNEVTLAPASHSRKTSGASPDSRQASPAPSSPGWPTGPSLRPLDYNTLQTAGQVQAELERTVADLGRWLSSLQAGLGSLA